MSTTPMTGSLGSIGGTALRLISTSTPLQYGTSIKAASSNTAGVYVGFSNAVTANTGASTDGYQLASGDAFFIPRGAVSDASLIYLISDSTSQKVFFVVI